VVAKNGILMLDAVQSCLTAGQSLEAALGLLPLAYGIGAGSDMLKPLAIAVIGALCLSVLLSLIATPTVYFLLVRSRSRSG